MVDLAKDRKAGISRVAAVARVTTAPTTGKGLRLRAAANIIPAAVGAAALSAPPTIGGDL